jgi:hypothetical protein
VTPAPRPAAPVRPRRTIRYTGTSADRLWSGIVAANPELALYTVSAKESR